MFKVGDLVRRSNGDSHYCVNFRDDRGNRNVPRGEQAQVIQDADYTGRDGWAKLLHPDGRISDWSHPARCWEHDDRPMSQDLVRTVVLHKVREAVGV